MDSQFCFKISENQIFPTHNARFSYLGHALCVKDLKWNLNIKIWHNYLSELTWSCTSRGDLICQSLESHNSPPKIMLKSCDSRSSAQPGKNSVSRSQGAHKSTKPVYTGQTSAMIFLKWRNTSQILNINLFHKINWPNENRLAGNICLHYQLFRKNNTKNHNTN